MKKYTIQALLLATLLPLVSFAAPLEGLKTLLGSSIGILNIVIKLTFGLAIIYFFYGMGQFILHSDEEKVREDGKQRILWGVIAIFVIASIMGIIAFIGDSTGIKNPSSGTSPAPVYDGGY